MFEFLFLGGVTFEGTAYTVQVSFLPLSATTTKGTFDSATFEVLTPVDDTFSSATGTYDGCTMKITLGVDGAGAAPQAPFAANYNGRFTSNDTLVLTPDGAAGLPTITLTRKPAGSRNMGC
ncbi:MAG: hypothetical protein ABJD97_03805 [Betaproteobacteria bacterium]